MKFTTVVFLHLQIYSNGLLYQQNYNSSLLHQQIYNRGLLQQKQQFKSWTPAELTQGPGEERQSCLPGALVAVFFVNLTVTELHLLLLVLSIKENETDLVFHHQN